MSITKLSNDGVLRLFQDPSSSKLIFQVLSFSEANGDCMMTISDGFVKVDVRLSNKAKTMVAEGTILALSIIEIPLRATYKLPVSANSPSFMLELTDFSLVYSPLPLVGAPITLEQFKLSSSNPSGNNTLHLLSTDSPSASPSILTKKCLLLPYLNSNARWQFEGTVIARTSMKSKSEGNCFFFITVADAEGQTVEGVFFREAAIKFDQHIHKNKKYVFSIAQIKHNRKNTDIEMVFYRDSLIEEESRAGRGDRGDRGDEEQEQGEFKLTPLQMLTEQPKSSLVNVLGLVCFCDSHSKYRKLKIADEHGNTVRATIWPEVHTEVRTQTWYLFTNMRVDVYRDEKGLMSSRTTGVFDRVQAREYPVVFPSALGVGWSNPNTPIDPICALLSSAQKYHHILSLLRFPSLFSLDPRKLFYVFCAKCTTPPQGPMSATALCATCGEPLHVRYNLKCSLTDTTGEIQAALNDDVAVTMLGWGPEEAARVFAERPELLGERMADLADREYVFRVGLKRKGDRNYINVLAVLNRNKQAELDRVLGDLRGRIQGGRARQQGQEHNEEQKEEQKEEHS